jgi:hypothetical protein
MAAGINSVIGDSQHITKPPFFTGLNYSYWKMRMKIFVQSIGYDVWDVIEDGPFSPTKIVDGITIAKPKVEWTADERKKMELNAKALTCLYCSLDANVFNQISGCESAKEVWDKIQVTYEGTTQVKRSKISILTHEYELFAMNADETIAQMSARFNSIINGLKVLGKTYSSEEMVEKFLRALPTFWDPKVTAIQEARDLSKMSLEELYGSLLTHEPKVVASNPKAQNESRKKKDIAFRSDITPDSEVSDSDETVDDDFALLTKKFKRFMRKKRDAGKRMSRKEISKTEERTKDPSICYECKKPGHFRNECPIVKRMKKFKKKAMAATWGESDTSSSDEESHKTETANICYMAMEEDEVTNDQPDYTYDELQNAFEELHQAYKAAAQSNAQNKRKLLQVTNEVEKLKTENKTILEERDELKAQINKLIPTNKALSNQICDLIEKFKSIPNGHILKKRNLIEHQAVQEIVQTFGQNSKAWNMLYKGTVKRISKNMGEPSCSTKGPLKAKLKNYQPPTARFSQNKKLSCFNCFTKGHTKQHCPYMKPVNKEKNEVWVPKKRETNFIGPKQIWVPKIRN